MPNLSTLKHSEYSKAKNNFKYAVYVHYRPDQNNKKHRWERASNTNDPDLAVEQAKMLFDSGRYEAVEVKNLSEDQKINAKKLKTFPVQYALIGLLTLLCSILATSYYLISGN